MSAVMMPDFPVLAIHRVWHTGTLNSAHKRRNSYEGAGLSVSECPDAWESIARGMIRGRRHELTCADGRFLDAHRMRKAHRAEIRRWAIAEGYAQEGTIYRYSLYNEDFERMDRNDFATREEALYEADGQARVRPRQGLIATDKFRADSTRDLDVLDEDRSLAPLYAEQVLRLDGVWWTDVLDELCLSAPCGTIAASRLGRWSVKRAKVSDDEALAA